MHSPGSSDADWGETNPPFDRSIKITTRQTDSAQIQLACDPIGRLETRIQNVGLLIIQFAGILFHWDQSYHLEND
jgi:hypothetical protein